MVKKLKLFTTFSLFFSSLLSCNNNNSQEGFEIQANENGSATIRIYKNNESTSKSRFIPPSKVKMKYSYNSLSGILSNNENVCPSIGNVNLLVIPVHLPGCDKYKTDEVRNDIEKMFFSTNDSRMGYKSVKEYFYESSYGKLNFTGKVTDWFDATSIKDENGNQLINKDSDITQGSNGTIVKILQEATSWATNTQNINLKDYDQNNDGSIDAIWLVYDHLDWTTQSYIEIEKDRLEPTSLMSCQ